MTRKDYQMIASAIRDALPSDTRSDDRAEQLATLRTATLYISDGLASDNPRFDRKRFMAACGFDA